MSDVVDELRGLSVCQSPDEIVGRLSFGIGDPVAIVTHLSARAADRIEELEAEVERRRAAAGGVWESLALMDARCSERMCYRCQNAVRRARSVLMSQEARDESH